MVCSRPSSALTSVYYTPDDTSQSSIFLYETSLITDIAALLVPGRGVTDTVTSAAIYAIDACAHHRSKLSEVVAAIGANVNHGILIGLFRDTVRRLTANEDVLYEVVDALMGLIAYVATSPPHSNQIIGAGIIPLLLDIPKTTVEKRVNVGRRFGIVLTPSMSHVPWVSLMRSYIAHLKD
jgi:E3 ubiquitin-protein ligase HUWE1